jgi:hypothetical protein
MMEDRLKEVEAAISRYEADPYYKKIIPKAWLDERDEIKGWLLHRELLIEAAKKRAK